MNNKYTVSLKDIAESTGVSISTVSRVIKNKGEISDATRKKIMNAARELGYHENRLSNAIRTGKTGAVGFIGMIEDSFFNNLFIRIHDELQKRNYLPIISWQTKNEREVIRRMIEQRVDGIIIVPTFDFADNSYFLEVIKRGLPIVSIDRKTPADIDFIGTDDYSGGWMMAEYFYGEGHREMGFYHSYPDASPANLRREGFMDFCSKHHDCSVKMIGHGGWSLESDISLIDFFEANPEVSAVGTITDYHAMQIVQILNKIGKKVPENISVIGFGNVKDPWISQQQITTFDQNVPELAESAVKMLLERINGSKTTKRELRIKPELIIRQSASGYDKEDQ